MRDSDIPVKKKKEEKENTVLLISSNVELFVNGFLL